MILKQRLTGAGMQVTGHLRRYIYLLLLVVFTASLISCGNQASDKELVQAASNYLSDNRVREAALELKNALKQNPANARARYLLGMIELDLGDFAAAEKELKRAKKSGWNEEQAVTALAQVLLLEGKYQEVTEVTKIGETWAPGTKADVLALQALALANTGDLDTATQYLEKAGKYDAEAIQVVNARAQIARLNGQASEATGWVMDALKKNPDSRVLQLTGADLAMAVKDERRAGELYNKILSNEPSNIITRYGRQARLGLARLAIAKRDFTQAHAALKPLLTRFSGDPAVNYFSGVLAFEEKDYEQAEIFLRKILKFAPNNEPTLLLFGTVSYAKGDYEQAAYSLSKYVSAQPDNLAARKLLGRTYIALEQPENARTALSVDADGKQDDVELLALTGLSALQSGQLDTGILKLEKAVELAPGSNAIRSELAKAYMEKGEVKQALAQLEKVIEADGDNAQAEIMLVFAYLKDNDFDKAIEAAQEMLVKKPESAVYTNIMGIVHTVKGDADKGRMYFEKALQLKPDYSEAAINLARLDEKAGNSVSARKRYQEILAKSPDNVTVLRALARLDQKQGDTAAQIEKFEQIRQADSKDIASRVKLAEYYIQKKNFSEAKALLKEMESAHADDATVMVVRAELLVASKSYNQAASIIRTLKKTYPDAFAGFYLDGLNLLGMGQMDKARTQLLKAHELAPDNVQNLVLLAQVSLKAHRFEDALVWGKKLQQKQPENVIGMMITGDALMGQKRYQAAETAYMQAWNLKPSPELVLRRVQAGQKLHHDVETILTDWLAQHPDNLTLRLKLAELYQLEGKNDKAITQYEKIISKQPENVGVLNNLAWIYNQQKSKKALDYAERAFKLNKSPAIKDTYGWVLLSNGEVNKALKLLTDAARSLPDNADVQYHYARALYDSGKKQQGLLIMDKLISTGTAFEGQVEAEMLIKRR